MLKAPSVKRGKVGRRPPVSCSVGKNQNATQNSLWQIPQKANDGLSEAEIKELNMLKAKHWPADGPECPTGAQYGPHVGTSCGMRLLRYLRHQERAAVVK